MRRAAQVFGRKEVLLLSISSDGVCTRPMKVGDDGLVIGGAMGGKISRSFTVFSFSGKGSGVVQVVH